MSSKVNKLLAAYRQHLTVPWQAGLAAIQRVIFAVYDKSDELRLRANVEEFALVTQQAGKQWLLVDLTNAFPQWMASQEYRDAYFECPEDLAGYQTGELTEFVASLTAQLKVQMAAQGGPDTVVALMGVGTFGCLRSSKASRMRRKGGCLFSSPVNTTRRTTLIVCWTPATAGTTWPYRY
jgi:hypothetical protein